MVNDKQFVIAKKKYFGQGFQHVTLNDGFVLSCHQDLPVYINLKYHILLLGNAWKVTAGTPTEDLENLAERYNTYIPDEEIDLMEQNWCGRYVLIIQGRVYLDAAGLLGIFFSSEGISSSILILADIMGLPEKIYQPSPGMTWLPAPLTQYEEIKRLLPGQVYNYTDGRLYKRQLVVRNMPESMNESERIKYFAELFSQSLRNMVRTVPDKKILIALTGGYDSRTLLALAEYAGIEFECFTLEHENISDSDTVIPRKLCDELKCGYTYIPREKNQYSEKLDRAYKIHTGGLANDADKLFYAYGQYQKLTEKYGPSILLRSSIWEIAAFYFQKFIGDEFDPESIYGNYNAKGLVKKSLADYFIWCRDNPQEGLNACNRFYWEQRCGSWLSAIEQSFDILEDCTSLQPLNSRLLISTLLGFPKEERIVKEHQVKMIAYACDKLKDIEFEGKKKTDFKGSIMRLKKLFWRLHSMGMKKTVQAYIHIIKIQKEKK